MSILNMNIFMVDKAEQRIYYIAKMHSHGQEYIVSVLYIHHKHCVHLDTRFGA